MSKTAGLAEVGRVTKSKGGRAALLSSAAMASALLALPLLPGTAAAQNACTVDGGTCSAEPDGSFDQTGGDLFIEGTDGIVADQGNVGVAFSQGGLETQISATVDLYGETISTTDASGVEIVNSASALDGPVSASLFLNGNVSVITTGDGESDIVRGVSVRASEGVATAVVNGSIFVIPNPDPDNSTEVVGLHGDGNVVSLTATGDISVIGTDGDNDATGVLADARDSYGAVDIDVQSVSVSSRQSAIGDGDEESTGNVRGVEVDGSSADVTISAGAVTVSGGSATGSSPSIVTGNATGFFFGDEIYGLVQIDAASLDVGSGSADGDGDGDAAVSGDARGVYFDDRLSLSLDGQERSGAVVTIDGSATVRTGAVTGANIAESGQAHFVEFDDDVNGTVLVDVGGRVDVASGSAEGVNAESGRAVGVEFRDEFDGDLVVTVGDFEIASGDADGTASAQTGTAAALNMGEDMVGGVLLTAGSIGVRSGDALSTGVNNNQPFNEGSASSGDARGFELDDVSGDVTVEISGDTTVESGDALTGGKYANSGAALGIEMDDVDGNVSIAARSITVESGIVDALGPLEDDGGNYSGYARAIDVEDVGGSLGIIVAGDVQATSGAIRSTAGYYAFGSTYSRDAEGVSISRVGFLSEESGNLSLTARNVTATSGQASGGSLATSGSAFGIRVDEVAGSATLRLDDVTVVNGGAGGLRDVAVGEAVGIRLGRFTGEEFQRIGGAIDVAVANVDVLGGEARHVLSGGVVDEPEFDLGDTIGIDLLGRGDITLRTGDVTAVASRASVFDGKSNAVLSGPVGFVQGI